MTARISLIHEERAGIGRTCSCRTPKCTYQAMKATKLLMDEHKYILRALNILEEMAACVERGQSIDDHDVEDMLHFLKMFADNHHQGKEEAVLFPAMLGACSTVHSNTLNQMIFEHDQERSLVEGIEDALRTKRGDEFVYFAQRLVHILRTHIYKEDHILFDLADRILSGQADDATARELEVYDGTWREKALNGLLRRVNSMEWKYLGRTSGAKGQKYA
jgi:hemerythrin-like domain-containing protein